MTGSTPRHSRLPAIWTAVRVPVAEVVLQGALIALATAPVVLLQGREMPERAIGTLTFTGGVAATILLAVAAWISGNRRARRVAAAVGVYAGVTLLLGAVDLDLDGGVWGIAGGVAVLGVAGLLVLAARPAARPVHAHAVGLLALVALATVSVAATALLAPSHVPSPDMVRAVSLGAWVACGVAGLLILGDGTVNRRPLLRRTGLAFAALGTAHAAGIVAARPLLGGVVELGAVAMLLVAAGAFLLASIRDIGREQERSRSRLAAVEAAMASVAERDHELRNVVAGLSGAATVLGDDLMGRSDDGRRLLVAAGAELARLQQMLDGPRPDDGPVEARVGAILDDLAVVHRATGLDVHVDVTGDPEAAIAPGVLAQVVTNLLVNCRRHAPGARVWLRARVHARHVRIDVSDDGPGLCAPPEVVLRRGVRGPDSGGDGLGLAITAELVERHRGTFTLLSGPGCTVHIELPVAGCRAPVPSGVS